MARCIIHMGMHKTGSTSIQNSLRGFADDRFLYANLGTSPNHSVAMYSLFADNPARHHIHVAAGRDAGKMRDYIGSVRADLERAISSAGGRSLLISGEDIGILRQSGLRRLRRYFSRHFDDITIVGYVRPPGGFMVSAFQQWLRNRPVDFQNLERAYRNYRNSFSKFDEIFGRDNVLLWKYDPGTFPGGCAVRDFCSRLEIALPTERIVRLNESLSREATGLLYTFRRLGKEWGSASMTGPQNHGLAQQLMKIGSSRFRFSSDVLAPVLEKNRADIEWMEARLGQPLAEDLTEHRPGEVRDESDLLKPDPESVGKLLAILGDRAPAGVAGATPEEVALLVQALRGEDQAQRPGRIGGRAAKVLSRTRHETAPDDA